MLICAFALTESAWAFEAGWRQIVVPGPPDTTVALYYPTQTAARAIPMGPFTVNVAVQAAPEPSVKGLIVLSHGTGGAELGHTSLAEALAKSGYLVAALRHPGDNWQDKSLLRNEPGRFFEERPRQVTRIVDALLLDPLWKDRIATDARGPRIGAAGHSAGGYTVLALAGGVPDLARVGRHCEMDTASDPIFCGMVVRGGKPMAPPTPLTDNRVRAVVAMAPAGVVFTAQSLAAIRIPVALYIAELDRFLVPRFHAEWTAQNVPGVELHRVRNAWHFAFSDTPGFALQSEDGDLRADPPGFDRAAFLKQLSGELPAFFDRVLQ
ncbi:MAG: dienelactone hydrolase [Acetobacteraceae bacterium]|nr:dienelactone hydrolase [Acetobacteraceae bacterium]